MRLAHRFTKSKTMICDAMCDAEEAAYQLKQLEQELDQQEQQEQQERQELQDQLTQLGLQEE